MKKHFIIPLLLALVVGLCAPRVFAQAMGSVKGVVKDAEGKPIVGVTVEWFGIETGRKYTLKTNGKGEYFSLGITPGKYKLTVSKDGKQIFFLNGIPVGVDEVVQDVDLKKEVEKQAQGQGMTAEQAKQFQEQQAQAAKETNTVKALNEKLTAAKTASDAGDFDTAIATLNEANQMDPTRDLMQKKMRTTMPRLRPTTTIWRRCMPSPTKSMIRLLATARQLNSILPTPRSTCSIPALCSPMPARWMRRSLPLTR